jgi:acetate---CoA ligase (ADP-forming)
MVKDPVEADRPTVAPLFESRSVALVGASPRPGSVGETMLRQLLGGGFTGEVVPVNPRYDAIDGLPCAPDLEQLDHPVDLAILAVPEVSLERELERAAATGVGAAVIFGSPRGTPEERRPLGEGPDPDGRRGRAASEAHAVRGRMRATALRAGMVICGPNCMGFVDLANQLRAVGYYQPLDRRPGTVSFISHSGSVFSALLHNRRGTEFDLVVSAGEELTHTVADYARYALDRERTRIIALFLETVRDPAGFTEVLALAAERDVPVVALTVGSTATSREFVEAHSGAVAGDDAAYEALFDRYGVVRVRTLDELTDTIELLAAGRRARPGGLAAVLDSGGERAHLIDVAASVGVPFAELEPRTVARLSAVLGPDLPPVNPLDAWGTNSSFPTVYRESIRALLDDPGTGAFTLAVDITPEDPEQGYVRLVEEAAASTDLPVAVVTHVSSAIAPRQAERLRRAGIPVLEGTASGMRALRALFELRDARTTPPPHPPESPRVEILGRWRSRLAPADRPLAEAEALALLADHGVPVVAHRSVASEADAVAAASALGWPVVLKTAAPGLTHKTEVDGVVLGLTDGSQVARSYRELAGRLGPEALVARQVTGIELALGAIVDPHFGPIVLVAAGGALVELLQDRAVGLAPFDAAWARRMIDRLRARPLLDGHRGAPAVDVEGLCRVVARFSVLAGELAPHLSAIDVNPLVVNPDGCVAVDALVVPSSQGR